MRRNCNLELRLFPYFSDSDLDQHHDRAEEEPQQQGQQHQQTIFYNGRVCVCDATELQARAILMSAHRKVEDKMMIMIKTPTGLLSEHALSNRTPLGSPMYSSANGLSMKRSLQRFLQKRNHRIQATYPYSHHACRVDH